MGTRGTITLVFDDGYQAVYDDVVPLLEGAQLPGVFAIPLTAPAGKATPPTASAAAWRPLADRGHELAAHSVSHTDLTQLADHELDRELREPAETLGATTLVYPGGAFDDRVVRTAKRYYEAARTTTWGFETVPPHDSMRLKTVNYSKRNWSLLKANARVLWAWLTGAWLIETFGTPSFRRPACFLRA